MVVCSFFQGELRSVQYTFDTISSILHLLSHSYHAVSDLMCDFSTLPENRRITAPATIVVEQSTVVRATIPIAVPAGALTAQQGRQQQTQPGTQATQNPSSNISGSADTSSVPTAVPDPQSQPPQPQPTPQQQQQPFPGFNALNFLPQFGMPQPGQGGGPGGVSINLQANGMPDLAALLGPALAQAGAAVGGGGGGAAGVLPLLTFGGLQASLRQPSQQSNGTRNQNQTQNSTNAPSTGTAAAGNANRQSQPNRTNDSLGNILAGNMPHNMRVEGHRPPFDVLLNCHSHHTARQPARSRPADLRQHINVTPAPASSAAENLDLLEGVCDILRYSTVLETIQPNLKDIVQNYLMRGRDVRNPQHVKTCAKSLAKKLAPFFQAFTVSASSHLYLHFLYLRNIASYQSSFFIRNLFQLSTRRLTTRKHFRSC